MKKILQSIMLLVSIALNVWGICSLLYINGVIDISLLSYLDSMRLILKYVIVVATMACGIMLFSAYAGTLKRRLRNILSISGCVYSTILTIPLLLTFVLSFVVMQGIEVPLVTDITRELQSIFTTETWQYVIFSAGTLMGIIFMAVPILMTVKTVKKR